MRRFNFQKGFSDLASGSAQPAKSLQVEAVPVVDDRGPQRGGKAAPADGEPAGRGLTAAEVARAVRGARVPGAVLGVPGERVGVGRHVRLMRVLRAVSGVLDTADRQEDQVAELRVNRLRDRLEALRVRSGNFGEWSGWSWMRLAIRVR